MTGTGSSAAELQSGTNRCFQTFGPIVFFLVLLFLAGWYFRSPLLKDRHQDFIVLVAVLATIVYSFLFLIAPEFHRSRGLKTYPGVYVLVGLLLIASAVSMALLSIYTDRTFFGKHENELYVTLASEKILEALVPSGKAWIPSIVHLAIEWHFLLFVLVFTSIDCVFIRWSFEPADKARFCRVLMIVDFPILVAVIVTLATKSFFGQYGEVFQAGSISFQFVSGTIAAYMLDAVWLKTAVSRGSESSSLPQKSTNVSQRSIKSALGALDTRFAVGILCMTVPFATLGVATWITLQSMANSRETNTEMNRIGLGLIVRMNDFIQQSTIVEARSKIWELGAKDRSEGYMAFMDAMQRAFEAAEHENKNAVRSELAKMRSSYYKLEPQFKSDQSRRDVWNSYTQFVELCSKMLDRGARGRGTNAHEVASTQFENFRSTVHNLLYSDLFIVTLDDRTNPKILGTKESLAR